MLSTALKLLIIAILTNVCSGVQPENANNVTCVWVDTSLAVTTTTGLPQATTTGTPASVDDQNDTVANETTVGSSVSSIASTTTTTTAGTLTTLTTTVSTGTGVLVNDTDDNATDARRLEEGMPARRPLLSRKLQASGYWNCTSVDEDGSTVEETTTPAPATNKTQNASNATKLSQNTSKTNTSSNATSKNSTGNSSKPELNTTVGSPNATNNADDNPQGSSEIFVVVTLTIKNVDYEKLSKDDKDELKSKVRENLATNLEVDEASVTVELSAGSIKVEAEIQASDMSSVESIMKKAESVGADKVAKQILEIAKSIPGVKEAATGELEVEVGSLEVVTLEDPSTKAPDSTQGGDGCTSSVFCSGHGTAVGSSSTQCSCDCEENWSGERCSIFIDDAPSAGSTEVHEGGFKLITVLICGGSGIALIGILGVVWVRLGRKEKMTVMPENGEPGEDGAEKKKSKCPCLKGGKAAALAEKIKRKKELAQRAKAMKNNKDTGEEGSKSEATDGNASKPDGEPPADGEAKAGDAPENKSDALKDASQGSDPEAPKEEAPKEVAPKEEDKGAEEPKELS